MRTPAGRECPHYFADFHRGRARQECRLLPARGGSAAWNPALCGGCPVPGIVLANGCPELRLQARVTTGFLGLTRRVQVSASCVRSGGPVEVPEIGCGLCHSAPSLQLPPEPGG